MKRTKLAACVLTGLLLSLTISQAQTVQGQAKGITGTVLFALPGETSFKPLTPNTALPVGSRVRTGSNGIATLLTVPEAAIRLQENTEITIRSLEYSKQGDQITKRNALIELNNGTMAALIKKNDPKTTDFRIQTPQGVAAARGTFYAVTVKDGKSSVAVKEGKVAVKSNAAKKSVAQAN